jgi:hypothetical protein
LLVSRQFGGRYEPTTAAFGDFFTLTFDRRFPLAREIDVYQRHRNKKLKQQQGRG